MATTKEVTPKAEKKVAAPKIEKKVTATKKVEEKVEVTATKVADSVKDTYTDIETALKDARVNGNARAKKILASVLDDKANDIVVDFVGYLGEATAVCSKVMCSPMTVPADKMNTLYKKITA